MTRLYLKYGIKINKTNYNLGVTILIYLTAPAKRPVTQAQ